MTIIRPLTANTQTALALHDVAQGLAQEIDAAARGIPPEAAMALANAVRGAVAQSVAGALPHQAAFALFLLSAAEIAADLLAELNAARPLEAGGAEARARGVEQAFSALLQRAVARRRLAVAKDDRTRA